VNSVFIEPLDVLALRGNKLFGEPGSYGESLIPPWPSAAAGAIRSAILAQDAFAQNRDPAHFARGQWVHPALGTPNEPGPFTVAAFHLARRCGDRVEPLFAPPADLVVEPTANGRAVRRMRPTVPATGLTASNGFSSLPVLAQNDRIKPVLGLWLTVPGWRAYLSGKPIATDHLVAGDQLWAYDLRIGIGLSPATRHVEEGKLFSAKMVAFKEDVGFLARVAGTELRGDGTLRFGGDGRGARILVVDTEWPLPDYDSIAREKRARLVLTTPGIFEGGWLPTGISRSAEGTYHFDLHGVRARLVCAAVPRAEVVSGFDLASWRPKPAMRAAPTGSVYWLDGIEGAPEALSKLAEIGLWPGELYNDPRRAEGFNRVSLAAYGAEGPDHV
jgi:CRISPR-associated protein Cmr3